METKPGYKTTEFWLSVAAMLVGALMASGLLDESGTDIDNKIFGLIAMVLAGLGYSANRAWTKGAEAKRDGMATLANGKPKDPS